MTVRVGINGFGRIGRLAFRAARGKDIEVVGINDLTDAKTLAHLLKYDSIHGPSPARSKPPRTRSSSTARRSRSPPRRDPAKLPWKELGAEDRDRVDRPLHRPRRRRQAPRGRRQARDHHRARQGPRRDDRARRERARPTTRPSTTSSRTRRAPPTASRRSRRCCTTTSASRRGWMTTIHAYTNDQVTLDFPHKDLRRARAAAVSMIPTIDRRREGDRPGAARAQGQARRLRDARADPGRLGGRPLGRA